jgi:hypothetical protein
MYFICRKCENDSFEPRVKKCQYSKQGYRVWYKEKGKLVISIETNVTTDRQSRFTLPHHSELRGAGAQNIAILMRCTPGRLQHTRPGPRTLWTQARTWSRPSIRWSLVPAKTTTSGIPSPAVGTGIKDASAPTPSLSFLFVVSRSAISRPSFSW